MSASRTARSAWTTLAKAVRKALALYENKEALEFYRRNAMACDFTWARTRKEYLAAQLRSFKASTRGELDGVMTSAAQSLSEHDMDVLAEYLSGLPTSP